MTTIFDVEVNSLELDIIDPVTNDPMGFRVSLRPLTDPVVDKVQKKYAREIRDALMRRKNTQALEEEQAVEVLASAVTGWEWTNATLGGTIALDPVEFTPDNVRQLLRAKKLAFIRRQIDAKLGEEGDFFRV